MRNSIGRTELMFPLTTRAVQKQLALVSDYLGYEGISTHSFRKWYSSLNAVFLYDKIINTKDFCVGGEK